MSRYWIAALTLSLTTSASFAQIEPEEKDGKVTIPLTLSLVPLIARAGDVSTEQVEIE